MIPEAYENQPLRARLAPGLKAELKAMRHRLRPLPHKRFFIFAQGRSGSTLLTSSLDSHPDIRCLDEILAQPRLRPINFVENVGRGSRASCFGFHVKCYQLSRWQRVRDLSDFLSQMVRRNWLIIYLWRENVVNHALSNQFAEQVGKYHITADDRHSLPKTIHVDVSRALKDMEGRERTRAWERNALAELPHIEIRYERDLLAPDVRARTLENIQRHIGVDPASLSSPLKKAVNRPLRDLVSNYEEFETALRGTEFERWLPDAPSTVAGGDRAS